jgi:regulator of RNase E activity RraA
VRGDSDGVIVIPQEHEDEVLAAAEEIDAKEEQIRRLVKDGMTLAEARRQLGYHQLQTKR